MKEDYLIIVLIMTIGCILSLTTFKMINNLRNELYEEINELQAEVMLLQEKVKTLEQAE